MCSQFVVDRPGEAIARGTRTGSIKVAETGARSAWTRAQSGRLHHRNRLASYGLAPLYTFEHPDSPVRRQAHVGHDKATVDRLCGRSALWRSTPTNLPAPFLHFRPPLHRPTRRLQMSRLLFLSPCAVSAAAGHARTDYLRLDGCVAHKYLFPPSGLSPNLAATSPEGSISLDDCLEGHHISSKICARRLRLVLARSEVAKHRWHSLGTHVDRVVHLHPRPPSHNSGQVCRRRFPVSSAHAIQSRGRHASLANRSSLYRPRKMSGCHRRSSSSNLTAYADVSDWLRRLSQSFDHERLNRSKSRGRHRRRRASLQGDVDNASCGTSRTVTFRTDANFDLLECDRLHRPRWSTSTSI